MAKSVSCASVTRNDISGLSLSQAAMGCISGDLLLCLSANVGQSCFDAMALIVKRVQGIVDYKNDQHSRNFLLTSYIQYHCTLPCPEYSAPLCKCI